MRITYFSRTYTAHDLRFLTGIRAHGHEVVFLCLGDPALGWEKRPLPEGVELLSLHRNAVHELADCLAAMPDFEKALARARPDVLHAGPVPTCGFMAALSGFRPLVLMSWGSDLLVEADRSPAWQWAATCALRHADVFQCDCDAVRAKALTLHPLQSGQIVQFPWGIDLNAFLPAGAGAGVREKLGWQAAVVVISNRSWEPIYGIGTVLESFRLAALADDRLRLLLLGHGSEVDMVHAYIRQHRLESKICLAGRVGNDQLAPYLREADLYLSCSHSDGASISLLEALAIGLPCVVSDIPGNREWIAPGSGGWLAPVGDAAAGTRALLAAAALTPAERRRMGEGNRAVAAARADWPRNLGLLMAAYARVAQGRKAGGTGA